jgi:hypothetical protein
MSSRLGGFIAGQNISASIGTFTAVTSPTFTFGSTQGTPAVGQAIQLTTTGTLPTGLSTNTTYYVISTSTNTCQLSTTLGGSAVTFTNSSGSGTHTAVTQRAFNPYAGAPDAVEYLVVAGGGGGAGGFNGGYIGNGGGGAGGLLTAANFAVVSGSALTITVGAGGARGAQDAAGATGVNSVFSSITASGGGGGGASNSAGNAGGSGGGCGGNATGVAGGTGVAGQGNAGGVGNAQGGGGGGAGSVGLSAVNNANASGGTGLCSTITGQRVFYAGGGGGGTYMDGTQRGLGLGGGGGGGNGAVYLSGIPYGGTPGTANTGGGGGGGAGDFSSTSKWTAGAGGSGIVIVRYPQINSAPALVTGSPQVSYSDGYQIYTWTSSGSIIF